MRVHSFESLAALDGDGIRYAIYLVSCPLRCIYCHNPDTWENAKGEYSARELANKIVRYKPYFKEDGGVTFSGGEPLVWAKDINDVYDIIKKEGIEYTLDTSGHIELTNDVKRCLDRANLVMLDMKFYDEESYKKYTGGDINKVLNTLQYLENTNKRVWIRTVIVPNINDREDILDKYLNILKNFRCIEKYELLAFHTMGFFKYEKLNIENKLKDKKDLDEDVLLRLQKYAEEEMKKWKR